MMKRQNSSISKDLDCLDFEARMYACPEQTVRRPCGCRRDPTIARLVLSAAEAWYNPDPAEQFMNPYLAMGNSPTVYVDPDGEFVFAAVGIGILANALLTGAVIGAASYTIGVGLSPGGFDNWDGGQFVKSIGMGMVSGAFTAGIGSVFGAVGGTGSVAGNIGKEFTRALYHGYANAMVSASFGNEIGFRDIAVGTFSSVIGSAGAQWSKPVQIGASTIMGGATSEFMGGDFLTGATTGATVGALNHAMHMVTKESNWKYVQKHATLKSSRQVLINDMLAEEVETHGADVTENGVERYYMLDNFGNSRTHSV